MKIGVIGCGLRTPLLIHGLTVEDTGITEISLYDVVPANADLMAALGCAVAGHKGIRIAASNDLRKTIEGCSFVISSIRVGGMEARARDERVSIECGVAGQETTGPAGFAMALRTIPVALEHARLVAELAPEAYLINFTNPAGLITQAIATHTGARVVGICDTPSELFQQIAWAIGKHIQDVECDYVGLNHLGWVTAVRVAGEDWLPRILNNAELSGRLYPAPLFSPELLQTLKALPLRVPFFLLPSATGVKKPTACGTESRRRIIETESGSRQFVERG